MFDKKTNGFTLKKKFPLITVEKLQLGNLIHEQFLALLDDGTFQDLKPCLDYDGILGFEVLSKLNIKLDMDNKRIIITDNVTLFQVDDTYKQPMTFAVTKLGVIKQPKIKMTVFDKEENVYFDTGSPTFGVMEEKKISKYKKEGKIKSENIKQYLDSAGNVWRKEIALPQIKAHNVKIDNYFIRPSSKSHFLLGASILNYADVVLNYHKKEFWLIPHDHSHEILIPASWGILSMYKNDKLIVSNVEEGSIACKAGLQEGFEIKSINDVPIGRYASTCDLYRNINFSALFNSVTLTLRVVDAEGGEKEYILER
jgi:hypothetical protein